MLERKKKPSGIARGQRTNQLPLLVQMHKEGQVSCRSLSGAYSEAGKRLHSISRALSSRREIMERCWGHTLSHWPQAMQSEAFDRSCSRRA